MTLKRYDNCEICGSKVYFIKAIARCEQCDFGETEKKGAFQEGKLEAYKNIHTNMKEDE